MRAATVEPRCGVVGPGTGALLGSRVRATHSLTCSNSPLLRGAQESRLAWAAGLQRQPAAGKAWAGRETLAAPGRISSRSGAAGGTAIRRRSGAQAVANTAEGVGTGQGEAGAGAEVVDCVVVGGGISGLSAALALQAKHAESVPKVVVTEARERVGGNITTVDGANGYLWEEGPNSFQPGDAILTAAADSDALDQLVLGDPDAPRFVFWEGRLRPVPGGLQDLPFFDLMTIFGKIRAGLGALGIRPPPPADGREESVEEFVRRNLGAEVFERLIEPFCSGVYAGNPAKLSMKAAFGRVWKLEDIGGSIIGGTIKLLQERKANPPPPRDPRLPKPKGQTVGSFKKGLITLPTAIAQKLGDKVRVQWALTKLQKRGDGLLKLTYHTPEGERTLLARSVLLTVPSYVAADLLHPFSESAAEALRGLYYPPVAAVTISYPLSAIRPDRLSEGELKGFGQLHPRSQGITTLGTIYSSSLFPGRAPPGRVLLLCYIGGATNTGITDLGEDEIVAQVDADLRKMLLVEDAPAPQVHGVRVWPRAIPQFLIGHLDAVDAAKKGLADAGLSGVVLGGNYVAGVALGRCVEGGYESARDIASLLEAKASSLSSAV